MTARSLCLAALIIGVVGLYAICRAQQEAQNPLSPGHKAEANRILDRAEAIYRAVRPEVHKYQISVERPAPGASVRYWYAICTDTTNAQSVHIFWNADTGDFFRLGGASTADPESRSRITAREAALISARWMRDLGLAAPAKHWKLVKPLQQNAVAWRVRWRSTERIVDLAIDMRDGALLDAQTRLPDFLPRSI